LMQCKNTLHTQITHHRIVDLGIFGSKACGNA